MKKQLYLAIMAALTTLTAPASAATYEYRVPSRVVVHSAPELGAFSLSPVRFGDAPFQLHAPYSASPGAFSFVSSNPAVASVSGNVLTITGAGTATITVHQAPSGIFTANSASALLSVAKGAPFLSTFTVAARTFGDGPFTISGPNSNAPGSITYTSSNPAVASVSGNTITIHGAGTTTITATQAASANYEAASASATLTIAAAAPTLGSFSVPDKTFGDAAFGLSAPSSNSAGDFSYTSSNPAVATVAGGTVTITGAGTTSITASQAASGNYGTATKVATLTVAKATPTLGTFTVPGKTVGDPAFVLSAPSSNSSGAFSYTSSNTAVATVSGATVTVVGAGTTTITASQAATPNYLAKTTTANLVVSPAPAPAAVTFTPCGATGAIGPSQSQCSSAYAGTTLAGAVTLSNGIQYWTVPQTGTYTITVAGARGGTSGVGGSYGKGAVLTASVSLTAGTQLKIVVGQMGTRAVPEHRDSSGGGGGTFVATSSNTLIMAAGGGGGYGGSGGPGKDASVSDAGVAGYSSYAGGQAGQGGVSASSGWGGAGAGFSTNGGADSNYGGSAALAFLNGATGGGVTGLNACANASPSKGGFGGGGGGGCDGGGGGGGYSGGGGGGGGGGSFYTGTLTSTAVTNTGNGYVTIRKQ